MPNMITKLFMSTIIHTTNRSFIFLQIIISFVYIQKRKIKKFVYYEKNGFLKSFGSCIKNLCVCVYQENNFQIIAFLSR